MGKITGISWTDHTFNPWWGCIKVSPACDSCYAETWAKRTGHEVWGKDAPRRFFGDKHWNEPRVWDEQSRAAGVRKKVFCASMADVFEKRDDLIESRNRLWALIEETPHLDWLLLTKRPQSVWTMVPPRWIDAPQFNAWFGVTAENDEFARKRLSHLRNLPNAMPWVSYEPALGPVDWRPYLDFVMWIIFGGESNSNRKSEAVWALDTLNQCREFGRAFFSKQAGNALAREWGCEHKEGKDPSEWPEQFRVQEFPKAA